MNQEVLSYFRASERDLLREIESHSDAKPGSTSYTIIGATRPLLDELGVKIPPELEQETKFDVKTFWDYGADLFFKPLRHYVLARCGERDEYVICQGVGLFVGRK